MKYIAWYTPGVYEEHFKTHLEPTLKKYDLDYDTIVLPNHKKWSKNVAQKPKAILEALKKHKQPIAVIDVDAKITAYPDLFERIKVDKFDIAFHRLDWSTWYNRPRVRKLEILTGTMWFNYTEKVVAFLEEWSEATLKAQCADQVTIEILLKGQWNDLRVCKLPLEYCYINSLPGGKPPYVEVKHPVVTHFQASRKARKGII